jgi:TetR/AcrR family transcriptional regulator, transcriptional repressor for nem operon
VAGGDLARGKRTAADLGRDGIDGLAVAELMQEAGLTHGGFYRHFRSRDQLVAEAAQRALSQGSEWTIAAGCGVAGIAADAARAGGPARASYTRQVNECLAVLADLTGNPDRQAADREAVLTLSALVGAISVARAVDDPDLARHILANAAAALKQCILN